MQRIASLLLISAAWVAALSVASAGPITTVPLDLNPGDQYRLVFVTSTTNDATSTDIDDYNAFVTAAANAVPELLALGTTWRAIGSTASVDARDNTGTNPTVESGVPIYTVGGAEVAIDNTRLWQAFLSFPPGYLTEQGGLGTGDVWTGTDKDGTKSIFPLGGGTINQIPNVSTGLADASDQEWIRSAYYPIAGLLGEPTGIELPMYAMSGVLTVVPEPSGLVLALLGLTALGVAALAGRRRTPCARLRETFCQAQALRSASCARSWITRPASPVREFSR